MAQGRSLLLLVRFGRECKGRYHQTTLSFNRPSASSVIITNPIHPLHGQSVAVRSIRQVGKLTKVIVEHPDGGLLSLPSDETSLDISEPCPKVLGTTPLFEPKQLLRLAEWMASKNTADAKETSSCPQHEEVVHSQIDAKTASTSPSPAKSNRRRAHPTPDEAESTVGWQNARRKSVGSSSTGSQN